MVLTISYSESACPITLVKPLKESLYDYFVILVYFVYFIHINNNKFTYDKFISGKFGFSICFSQVLFKLFTFLMDIADKEINNKLRRYCVKYSIEITSFTSESEAAVLSEKNAISTSLPTCSHL